MIFGSQNGLRGVSHVPDGSFDEDFLAHFLREGNRAPGREREVCGFRGRLFFSGGAMGIHNFNV